MDNCRNSCRSNDKSVFFVFFLFKRNFRLFAVSPGLFTNTSYTLVTVDPTSGSVTPKFSIANGKYVMFYGGDVFGWNYKSRILQYALHDQNGNGAIASINVDNGQLSFLPVVNLPQIHNLVFVA